MTVTVGPGLDFPEWVSAEAGNIAEDHEIDKGINHGAVVWNGSNHTGLKIYAKSTSEFQGIDGDTNTIAGAQQTSSGSVLLDVFSSNMEFQGLMLNNINPVSPLARAVWARANGTIIDKMLMKQSGTAVATVTLALQYTGNKTITNNVIIVESGSHTGLYTTGTSGEYTHRIKHNTVIGLGTSNFGFNNDGNSNPIYEVENNISTGFLTADYLNPGIFDIFTKSASSDTSGSEAGLRSITVSDHLVDVTSNWNLKDDSFLIGAGTNLSAESDLNSDAAGTLRSIPYDIGAMARLTLLGFNNRTFPRGISRGTNRGIA